MVAGFVASQDGHRARGAVCGDGLCDGRLSGPCPSRPGWRVCSGASSARPTTLRISSIVARRVMRRKSGSGSTSRSSSSRRETACAAARVSRTKVTLLAADCLPRAPRVPLSCRGTRLEHEVQVTAKLSRRFYDRFGDDIANELVDWFNKVDATYRFELRELNEVNFGRFDAKLEQRIAEVKAALGMLESRLETRMATVEARIIKWMFLFWVGQAVTTAGVVLGVVRLTGP